MNRIIEVDCSLIDVLEWGRRNAVPICMIVRAGQHINGDFSRIHRTIA
jgi:hypothetical protein